MTFDEICRLEPRVLDLYEEAVNADPNELDYSELSRWFGYGVYRGNGIKPRLVKLVGWQRCQKDRLATSEAYDIAYKTILDALPDEPAFTAYNEERF